MLHTRFKAVPPGCLLVLAELQSTYTRGAAPNEILIWTSVASWPVALRLGGLRLRPQRRFYFLRQLRSCVRLLNKARQSLACKPVDGFGFVIPTREDDLRAWPDLPDLDQRVLAAHYRHRHIENHHRDTIRVPPKHLDALVPILRRQNFIPIPQEAAAGDIANQL